MTEHVKSHFDTTWGNIGIVIGDINENVKRFTSKIMSCNLLRKFHRGEALVGVIAEETQCTKGFMFSWVPYLLKQFLIDYRNM
jgi:hypothetical protein